MTWEVVDWRGLYGDGWKGAITDESFSHPAKFARALISRIYKEMFGRGWLVEGDSVIDPFGGVALGAMDALRLGLHWRGCELEPRFVRMGNENIDWWNWRGQTAPRWGTAVLLRGDSRNLRAVLGQAAAAACSSPPYASSDQNYKAGWARFHAGHAPLWRADSQREAEYGAAAGQLGAMPEGSAAAVISSPPFLQTSGGARVTGAPGTPTGDSALYARHSAGNGNGLGYGLTAGQLDALPSGDVDAAISSPPYAADEKHDHTHEARDQRRGKVQGQGSFRGQYGNADGQLAAMRSGDADAAISSPPFMASQQSTDADFTLRSTDVNPSERKMAERSYMPAPMESTGQLATLAAGEIDAALSSPPYEEQPGHVKPGIDWQKAKRAGDSGGQHHAPGAPILNPAYGESEGQLGTRKGGETFWTAARQIVTETYLALRPGGHAAWVVKGFVKGGKLIDFPDQWRRLCESVGFETVAEVRAWVVEANATQAGMLGVADQLNIVSRKSFFRRLAEKKGAPPIDYETVWLMVKP